MISSRTVRVFLSSTFRDFAEERDLLVKKIFPELRRRCRERQVELVDVDLRWGITEEQAQRGEVLPICLAEIDRSRPYFMGFIGDRYGWVPEHHQYDLSLLVEQPWLEEHRGGKSVTELEMLHGVLNNSKMKDRAFFYFRNAEYSQSKGGSYLSEGPKDAAKLEELKDRIRSSGFPVVENYPTPEALAEQVREDLWKVIDEAYPVEDVPDPLMLERRKHEAYGGSRLGLYLGGKQYFKALDAAMEVESFKPVLIAGASGGGKSALIANWSRAYSEKHPETLEIVHYLGSGADAADPVKLVTRLLKEIAYITEDIQNYSDDAQQILDVLPEWLARASSYAEREAKHWLIMLDGLDKLSSMRDLRWWPSFIPPRIKIVVSCLVGEVQDEARKRMEWTALEVHPFTLEEQRKFITEYLGKYRKTLKPEQVARVQEHPLSGNPLFLRTLLEELRIFGVHEELEKKITWYLDSQTVEQLFTKVLERVEGDTEAKAVRSAMEAIWASRAGLSQDELLALAGLVPATWAPIHNALDEAIFESGGRIQFVHDYVRTAVENRYLATEDLQKKSHVRLAECFASQEVTIRVAEELPWQWQQAGEKQELKKCLTQKELFLVLSEKAPLELLSYWLGMPDDDLTEVYGTVWRIWTADQDQEQKAEIAGSLGGFLFQAGSFGDLSEELHRNLLLYKEKSLGPDNPKTLEVLNALGILLSAKGDYEGARQVYLRTLDARMRILGADAPDTLSTLNNLGALLGDMGVEMCRQSLERHEKLFGSYHSGTVECLNNIGFFLGELGKYKEAERFFRRATDGYRKIYGPDHPDTLTGLNNIASTLDEIGQFQEAEECYRKSLEGCIRVLGPNHPDTVTGYNNLGFFLSARGRLEEAEIQLRQAVDGYCIALGDDHPNTLSAISNLSTLLSVTGDFHEAEILARRSLKGRLKALGPDHPDTFTAYNNLGSILSETADKEGARNAYQLALDGYEDALGSEHPNTLSCFNNIAALLMDMGDYPESQALFNRALEGRINALGEEHEDTLNTVISIAELKLRMGDPDGAEACARKALQGLEETFGAGAVQTCKAVDTLARIFLSKLQEKKAWKLLEKYAGASADASNYLSLRLACCSARSGSLQKAKDLIGKYVKAFPHHKEKVLKENDLKPIQEFITALM
jgi:tetratricopeptide (TPR) repeat protein